MQLFVLRTSNQRDAVLSHRMILSWWGRSLGRKGRRVAGFSQRMIPGDLGALEPVCGPACSTGSSAESDPRVLLRNPAPWLCCRWWRGLGPDVPLPWGLGLHGKSSHNKMGRVGGNAAGSEQSWRGCSRARRPLPGWSGPLSVARNSRRRILPWTSL